MFMAIKTISKFSVTYVIQTTVITFLYLNSSSTVQNIKQPIADSFWYNHTFVLVWSFCFCSHFQQQFLQYMTEAIGKNTNLIG